jgi:photosystem II stability/assembly factor-like uncharacterized protein
MLRQLTALSSVILSLAAWSAGTGNVSPPRPAINTDGRVGWQSTGPAPPAVEAAILSDPASRTIYLGSLGGGLLKSTDGGVTFSPANNGLEATTISAMVMAPGNPDVVYANGEFDGFYKTIDGGANWYPIDGGGVSLVIDPSNPDILYAGLAPAGGVIKTTDGGNSWFPATDGMGEPAVFGLAIDPHNPSVLYAGTRGQGVYKSVDGAATWTPLNVASSVDAVLVDPDDSNVIYAGSYGNGVYRSTNAGASFVRIGSPAVGAILSLAKSGQSLYAGTASQGVSVSNDGGRTWMNTGVSKGLGLTLTVDSAGSVYLGTNFDGAFVHSVSEPGWRRLAWRQLQRCACQNGHAIAVDPADGEHVFLSTNDGGLLVTDDGGRTWKDGGTNGFLSRAPRGIAFDPLQPRRVYAGSFTGGGLFKSEDHGKHWQRRLFGPPDIYVTGVSVDPVDHSVYAITLGTNGIWKSTDYGDTFTRIDRAPHAPAGGYLGLGGRTLTVDPHRHRTIYVADNSDAAGIWRSRDGGASWIQVDATDAMFSVTVDPTNSNIVYGSAVSVGVLKSFDGGATFALKSDGLPADYVRTSRTGFLQVNPQRPNVLYLGTEGNGVFKSTDGAESWFPVNLGLDDQMVTGLAMDPESPDTVYAATFYSSVFKTKTGGR